ncbi:hypothetical protein, partial [Rhizobacter sp. P5_C2]
LREQRDLASLLSFDESLHAVTRSAALPQLRRSPQAIKLFSHSLGRLLRFTARDTSHSTTSTLPLLPRPLGRD